MSKHLTGFLLLALAAIVLLLFTLREYEGGRNAVPPDDVPRITAEHPSLGRASAPVRLVAYGAYDCRACGELSKLLTAALREFGGDVYIIWKDTVPPASGSLALEAAEVARCAGKQSAFWPMHNILFARQDELGPTLFSELIDALGMDTEQFSRCLAGHESLPLIRADFEEARRFGFERLPALFVNSRQFVGVPNERQFLDFLRALIEQSS